MKKQGLFHCPECGANGEIENILIDWCPSCGAIANWIMIDKHSNHLEPVLSAIILGSYNHLIWGEYNSSGYCYVRFPKNYLPISLYVYDVDHNHVIDPITLEIVGCFDG
jgi:hypothetical protein